MFTSIPCVAVVCVVCFLEQTGLASYQKTHTFIHSLVFRRKTKDINQLVAKLQRNLGEAKDDSDKSNRYGICFS